ncbi:HET-domain-containing protein [Tothia fuscella]|uniref:HET-domain-containing protein n=1 Tax=Tothia fuscella TaxID=1048955 RepID=A0A9P4U228_9PEZI|nr:HET-domain-containing protein [Tothia fuscella]
MSDYSPMKYIYHPLSLSTVQGALALRLIHLHPSENFEKELQCELEEISVGPDQIADPYRDNENVVFAALSYTWGEPTFSKSLYVLADRKNNPAGEITITENLHAALKYLRRHDDTVVLWVDAVCINQSDIQERNSQVTQMATIYHVASEVLVWLGSESPFNDGQLCLDFFTRLGHCLFPIKEDSKSQRTLSTKSTIDHEVELFQKTTSPGVVNAFLERFWFTRLWVIQEIIFAKDLDVFCGRTSTSWFAVEYGLGKLLEMNRGQYTERSLTTIRVMSQIRNGRREVDPFYDLFRFSNFHCSDPKDRIYALLGVMDDDSWIDGPPVVSSTVDYTDSVENVYTRFAIERWKVERSKKGPVIRDRRTRKREVKGEKMRDSLMQMLILAAAYERSREMISRRSLPTWVPNWNAPLRFTPMAYSSRYDSSSYGVPFRDMEIVENVDLSKSILLFTGIAYDMVEITVPFEISSTEPKELVSQFLSVVSEFDQRYIQLHFANGGIYTPTKEELGKALAATIIANEELWEVGPEKTERKNFPQSFFRRLQASDYTPPAALDEWTGLSTLLNDMTRSRCLFATGKGYMGITTDEIKPNDIVCVLGGMKMPCILRTTRGEVAQIKDSVMIFPESRDFRDDETFKAYCKERDFSDPNKFQDNGTFKAYFDELSHGTDGHLTFDFIGDAYIHGLMDGNVAESLGSTMPDRCMMLPIV